MSGYIKPILYPRLGVHYGVWIRQSSTFVRNSIFQCSVRVSVRWVEAVQITKARETQSLVYMYIQVPDIATLSSSKCTSHWAYSINEMQALLSIRNDLWELLVGSIEVVQLIWSLLMKQVVEVWFKIEYISRSTAGKSLCAGFLFGGSVSMSIRLCTYEPDLILVLLAAQAILWPRCVYLGTYIHMSSDINWSERATFLRYAHRFIYTGTYM